MIMFHNIRRNVIVSVFVFMLNFIPAHAKDNSDKFTQPIVEQSVTITDISYEELKAIFTLSVSRWSDGRKITLVILPADHPLQRKFLFEYLGITPSRYNEIIDSKIYSGRAPAPTVLNSEFEIVKKVSKTNGSIGFVGPKIFIGDRNGIKIITVR